ncbi:hypothetical protein FGB62_44g09 [Gracilaria domingensis]|nr:hypothetical protein FGB62_44g09 [Gracilaria domingensis]
MRLAAVFFAVFAAVATAQMASEEAELEFQTEYGWIEASFCSSYEELQEQLLSVVTVLINCGISKERAANYSQWVVNENVYTVVDEPDMVCIPPESNTDIGTRLGEIAREHVRMKGWEKRRRDDSPQLAFDGTDRDDTLAQKSCCKCSADEYPRVNSWVAVLKWFHRAVRRAGPSACTREQSRIRMGSVERGHRRRSKSVGNVLICGV